MFENEPLLPETTSTISSLCIHEQDRSEGPVGSFRGIVRGSPQDRRGPYTCTAVLTCMPSAES